MPKDKDQLTPAEPADRPRINPRRSAAREATGDLDESTGPGPASSGSDPEAKEELPGGQSDDYR